MKILLAGALTACIRAYEHLLASGVRANDIRVLTHDFAANAFVVEYLEHRGAEYTTGLPDSPAVVRWANDFSPDLLLSFYYRKKVPLKLLNLPTVGAVNLHPSLLPKYRGGFSAPWAIINGETVTGVSYHYMVEEFDAGNIVLQQELSILPNDTALSLYHRQLIFGLSLFDDMMHLVLDKRTLGRPQAGEHSVYSRKLPNGGLIDLNWSRPRTERFIRAMYFPPHRGAILKMPDGSEVEILDMKQFDSVTA